MPTELQNDIHRLLDIMRRLRDPETGCPWDRAQLMADIVPHTIEEAYEVAEAVVREQPAELCDELGDLLFQIVFYAQIAGERGWFGFPQVVQAITAKLIRRHPRVLGNASVQDPAALPDDWERIKSEERSAQGGMSGVLDGVARALPALSRAAKLQKRAAAVGFDWPAIAPVWQKLEEEVTELKAAHDASESAARLRHELGDVLFACTNLARHLGVDPERALRECNERFERRFQHIEARVRQSGMAFGAVGLEALDAWWEEAKNAEGGG